MYFATDASRVGLEHFTEAWFVGLGFAAEASMCGVEDAFRSNGIRVACQLRGQVLASHLVVYQGIISGAIAGLVGTWAMSEVQRLWTLVVEGDAPDSAGGRHDARDWQERSEHQNANELAAQTLAGCLLGRRLSRKELGVAAPLMHYLFGAAMGAIYGACAERRQAEGSGAGFGTTVWLAADEIAMPLFGLSDSTAERPLEMHLQSLVAHLVYGTTTEVTRRSVRARFNGATPHAAREMTQVRGYGEQRDRETQTKESCREQRPIVASTTRRTSGERPETWNQQSRIG